jgi:hypothetical protein
MIPVGMDLKLDFSPGTGMAASAMAPATRLSHALLTKFLDMQTANHIMAK